MAQQPVLLVVSDDISTKEQILMQGSTDHLILTKEQIHSLHLMKERGVCILATEEAKSDPNFEDLKRAIFSLYCCAFMADYEIKDV